MSEPKIVSGVCCQYCIHFEQSSCPISTASPWSRCGNFCNAYAPNPKYPDAKPLIIDPSHYDSDSEWIKHYEAARQYSVGYKQGYNERQKKTTGITSTEKLNSAEPAWRSGYMDGWRAKPPETKGGA